MKSIFKKLDNETLRIESVILLAGAMAAGDSFPDSLNDFFDDADDETVEKCFGEVPEYVDLGGSGYRRAESISEWLLDSGKLGFLIKFATPIMKPVGNGARSFSWGYYNTTWIYADTLKKGISSGIKWAKERRRSEDKKAKEAKEAKAEAQ